jgi:hypothetical protein
MFLYKKLEIITTKVSKGYHGTQHDDIQENGTRYNEIEHNDTQHKNKKFDTQHVDIQCIH